MLHTVKFKPKSSQNNNNINNNNKKNYDASEGIDMVAKDMVTRLYIKDINKTSLHWSNWI